MNSDLYLQIAGTFITYSLQLAAGLALCVALARLAATPGRRFRLWLGFMAAGGAYGLALIALAFLEFLGRTAAPPALAAAEGGRHFFLIPQPWKATLIFMMPIVFRLYAAIVAALLLATLWRQARLHLLLRYGRMPGDDLAGLFHDMRGRAGAGWCELRVVPGLVSPATAFWWKPRILVPEVCEEMVGSPALTGALWHELVHVRRRDYLWAVASDLICSILFFHPAVWKARTRMRVERELACDQEVIAANPAARADYAESLTRFARLAMLERRTAAGIDFAAPVTFLSERIRAILREDERPSRWITAARAAASFVLLAVFLVLLPALVVGMRFAASAPIPSQAGQPRSERPVHHNRGRGHVSGPASGSALEETQATRMAPRWRPGSAATGDEKIASAESAAGAVVENAGDNAWQERSPGGSVSAGRATLRSVLLQTAGVLIEGKEDRPERAPRKRLPGR